jgi:anti-anti-sigma factor
MGAGQGIVWYLRTSQEEVEGACLLVVQGRVSNATAGELSRALMTRLGEGSRSVIVDMTGVDYINGAGLRAFETAAAGLDGSSRELVVFGLQPPVQAAFELAGSTRHLAIEPSREAAYQRLRQRVV